MKGYDLLLCLKCAASSDKGLTLFDECAAKCVHPFPSGKKCNSSWGKSKVYTPSIIVNLQRVSTEINKKNSAFAKVRTLVEQVILQDI